jgi:hypothetical protein
MGGFSLPVLEAITVQDMVTGGVTPATIRNALQGQNVTISNMTVVNNGCNVNPAIGLFNQGMTATGAGPVLGDVSGVVLSTGVLNGADPLVSPNNFYNWTNTLCPANVSDVDMLALEPFTQFGEYVALEFDVIPTKGIMAIPFQFASDEFPEYVCTSFNDAVGIFVSGPGIAGPYTLGAQNFAKTAAGDLTSINWVNTGQVGMFGTLGQCGSLTNTAYYTDNSSGNVLGGNNTVATTNANLEMDGWTNYIYQPVPVTPGATYHVKAVVADAGDRLWDSAVFFHLIFSTGSFSGFDFGDAPDSYRTLTSNGGASHGIDAHLYLGLTMPDNEITGTPSVAANGDDAVGVPDDEDGVSQFPTLLVSSTSYSVNVVANNSTGSTATLTGWIDFNGNGQFDAAEGAMVSVPNGAFNTPVTLTWSGLSGLVAGTTYARLRLTTSPLITVNMPGGNAPDGEVEDYLLPILGMPDYGDAPDVYHTLATNNGAAHGITAGLHLGLNAPDTEVTGIASVNADGDDFNGVDDEDGITVLPPLSNGSSSYTVNVRVSNTLGSAAQLIAWLDFNRNGVFDASEATVVTVANGTVNGMVTLNWTGLNGLVVGNTYLRLRLSNDPTMTINTPSGAAINGEVEDYALSIVSAPDYGDAPDSYHTLIASGGASHTIDGQVYMGLLAPDTEADGQPTVAANGDDANGSADEDGVVGGFSALTLNAGSYTLDVTVSNQSGSAATLVGWIDFNRNGVFESSEAASTTVANGSNGAVVTLSWGGLSGLVVGNTYARLRLSTDPALNSNTPAGALGAGEVEDYALTIFNAMGEACIPPGATAYYPWNGNSNDFAGVYNLVAGNVAYDALDYISTQAASFNGSNQLLQYSNGTFMNQAFSNMSLLLWIKPSTLVGVQTLFDEGGNNRRGALTLRLNGSNLELGMFERRRSSLRTLTAAYPTDGRWHLVAVVYANGQLSLYLDGVSVATVATGFANFRSHNDPAAFGATNGRDAFSTTVGGNYYQGFMDEAAYYYSALSAANVAAYYACLQPQYDFGDAPAMYSAAEHRIMPTLYLGTFHDGDSGNWGDGMDSNNNATDDDTLGDPAGGIDDEDGIASATEIPYAATTFSVDVYASNQTTTAATLYAWLDGNQNGVFEASEVASVNVPSGTLHSPVTVQWTGLTGATVGAVYLRLRLTTDNTIGAASAGGFARDGEVEDYRLPIQAGLPSLTVTKVSQILSDPSGAATPRAIPGAVLLYTIHITNVGVAATGVDSVVISDPFSGYTSLVLDYDSAGPINGPVLFVDLVSSGLSYNDATDITYYNAAGTAITPVATANGTDPLVRKIVINPKGSMPASTPTASPSFQVLFKVIIE